MFTLKKQHKICRSYQLDIWGKFRLNKKYNKVYDNCILSRKRARRRPKVFPVFNINFEKIYYNHIRRGGKHRTKVGTRLLLSYFYGGIKKKIFYHILKKSSTKKPFLCVLESRLSTVVYRMNFCSTILEAIHFVLQGYILVNQKRITNPGYFINSFDLVEVTPSLKKDSLNQMNLRLKNKTVGVLYPNYLEIDYSVMSGLLRKTPDSNEVYFPFKISGSLGK